MIARTTAAACGLAIAIGASQAARAEPAFHGDVGVGGALLLTGDDNARDRLDAEVELLPGGAFDRFGGALVWHAVDRAHHGLVTADLVYVAAASRPRLVLALHGDVGADLDVRAPVLGGGVRTTLQIVGPIAVAFDSGAELVIDGLDHSRLALAVDAMLVTFW